jgi:putative nucleotidyltransferase with HDIG domain
MPSAQERPDASPGEQAAKAEESWQRLLQVKQLPTLPLVVQRLHQALEDPFSDARDVAELIQSDPAIMARIMKVVNSAFFRGVGQVASLHEAVVRLGLQTVFNIAVSTSVLSSFGPQRGTQLDRRGFWRHCAYVAIGNIILAEFLGLDKRKDLPRDLLYLSGLLHDMGKLVFEQHFHSDFSQALTKSHRLGCPLYETEQRVLGLDHAMVGAWLAERWKLPDRVCAAIRWHHDPEQSQEKDTRLMDLTAASNVIINQAGLGNGGDPAEQSPSILDRLGIDPADCLALAKTIETVAAKSFMMKEIEG